MKSYWSSFPFFALQISVLARIIPIIIIIQYHRHANPCQTTLSHNLAAKMSGSSTPIHLLNFLRWDTVTVGGWVPDL